MPSATRSFRVAPGPRTVISYLSDFSHAEEWDPGTVSCTRTDDGPVVEGATWRNVSRFAGMTTELSYTLRQLTGDRIVFIGENKGTTSADTITVEPDGTGTQVTYRADLALRGASALLGPVMKLVFEKMATDTERQLTQVLNGLPTAP